ncbi:MAG: hypothetical protein DELT_02606 [Desulfovibrio sp.]
MRFNTSKGMNRYMVLAIPRGEFTYSALVRNVLFFLVFFLLLLLPISSLQAEERGPVSQDAAEEILDAAEAMAFTQAMASLYRSPKPLVRVLAYLNTAKIPRSMFLEKELRELLPKTQSKTEQYIILYALASLTHSDQDFSALLEHSFRFPYVVSCASSVEESVRVAEFTLTILYPWMVHNTTYKRDAWLRGIICADYICGTLSSEARSDYLAYFPKEIAFPEYWRSGDEDKVYKLIGLSQPEIAWLRDRKIPPEESMWLDSCEMPYMDNSILSLAWGKTFDAFLPLMDSGGKNAELAKIIAEPALRLSNPGGKYSRLLTK